MEPAPVTSIELEIPIQSDVLLQLLDQQIPHPEELHALGQFAARASAFPVACPPPQQFDVIPGAALPAAAQTTGAAQPTGPSEPATHLKPYLPPLHLTADDQAQIRAALAGKQTQVEFKLKGTKKLKSFTPAVGAKAPAGFPAHALPVELTQKLPQLADYKYAKFNGDLLIINPMTHKIVSKFPEQTPPA
jgi:hypothetical protein